MASPTLLDVAGEYMHAPTDHSQFSESRYFNFVDGDSGYATLVRMGNRANEGHAEVPVPVYLPVGAAGGSGIAGTEDAIATGHYQRPCRIRSTLTIDDLAAYGISGYHDRMTDGVPAGMHEV